MHWINRLVTHNKSTYFNSTCITTPNHFNTKQVVALKGIDISHPTILVLPNLIGFGQLQNQLITRYCINIITITINSDTWIYMDLNSADPKNAPSLPLPLTFLHTSLQEELWHLPKSGGLYTDAQVVDIRHIAKHKRLKFIHHWQTTALLLQK